MQRVSGVSGWERAIVNGGPGTYDPVSSVGAAAVNCSTGLINVTLLTGPTIDVPFIGGPPPGEGELVWVVEVSQGVKVCFSVGAARTPWSKWYLSASPPTLSTSSEIQISNQGSWVQDPLWIDSRDNTGKGGWPFPEFGTTLYGNGAVTVPWQGVYRVNAQVSFASNATGPRLARLLDHSNTSKAVQQFQAVNGGATICAVSSLIYVPEVATKGNTSFFLNARQISGGNLALVAGIDQTFIEYEYLGNPNQPTSV